MKESFELRTAKLRDLGYEGPFYDLDFNTIQGYTREKYDLVFFRFVEGDIHVYKWSHTEK